MTMPEQRVSESKKLGLKDVLSRAVFHEDDWKDGRNRDTRSRKCKPGYESCVTAERDMNEEGKRWR